MKDAVEVEPREADVICQLARVDRVIEVLKNIPDRRLDALFVVQSGPSSHRNSILRKAPGENLPLIA